MTQSFYKEGLIRFDETPCPGFDLRRDLTPETWARFAARARIPADVEPQTALENLHLAPGRHRVGGLHDLPPQCTTAPATG